MKKKVLNIEFGSRIKELRYNLPKRDGNIVLQREIAKEAGISVSSYQQAEAGFIPGRAVLTALSEYFNESKEYLEKGQIGPIPEVAPPFREGKSELQDGEGLSGKKWQQEFEGTHTTFMTFEPKEEQRENVIGMHPHDAAIMGLREIFDSNDSVLIPAIQANIRAFQLAARREHQNAQQARQIKALQDECDEFKKRLEDLERKLEDNPPHNHKEEPTKQKAM